MKPLLLVAIVCACGGAPRHQASRPAPPAHGSTPAAPPGATAEDCDALFSHAVELAAAEHPDPRLTDDDRARVKADLAQTYGAACRGISFAGLQCGTSARTLAELDACAKPAASTPPRLDQ